MFHLRPVAAENEDFLYRAYPKDWTVARKPKLGPPKARSNADKTNRRLWLCTRHARRIQSVVFLFASGTPVDANESGRCVRPSCCNCARSKSYKAPKTFWGWCLAIGSPTKRYRNRNDLVGMSV